MGKLDRYAFRDDDLGVSYWSYKGKSTIVGRRGVRKVSSPSSRHW